MFCNVRYPVEKERPLDASVFLRFAACGALCGSTAHAALIPIDVVKTKMQAEPKKYPDVVSTFNTLVKEEVRVMVATTTHMIARLQRDFSQGNAEKRWARGREGGGVIRFFVLSGFFYQM